MRRWMKQFVRQGFFLAMAVGSLLITLASLEYFQPDRLAPFVIEKLPLRFESVWMVALRLHVASAVVTFPLCILLMTRWMQRHKVLHRWVGRLVGAGVVFALVPSGIVLSLEAKGGAPVTVGFLLSAVIVLWGMIAGIRSARGRRLGDHARAMRHVVAQMSVAVTSRAMLIGLDVAGVSPETAYVVALWVPVVASFVAAEWLSGRLLPTHFQFSHPIPRSLS